MTVELNPRKINAIQAALQAARAGKVVVPDAIKPGQVKFQGIVLEAYPGKGAKPSTKVTILIPKATARYPDSTTVTTKRNSGEEVVAKVNVETSTVDIQVAQGATFKTSLASYAEAGVVIEPSATNVVVADGSIITVKLTGELRGVPKYAFVQFTVTSSAYIAPISPETRTTPPRVITYMNTGGITLLANYSGGYLIPILAGLGSLTREFPSLQEMLDNTPYAFGSNSRKTGIMLIATTPKGANSRLAEIMMSGNVGQSAVVAVCDSASSLVHRDAETEIAIGELLIRNTTWDNTAENPEGTMAHVTLRGRAWTTRPYGITNVAAWAVMGRWLVQNTSVVFPVKGDLGATNDAPPGFDEENGGVRWSHIRVDIGEPIVALEDHLRSSCVPVSRAFVKCVLEGGFSLYVEPVEDHSRLHSHNPRVLNLSERPHAEAARIVESQETAEFFVMVAGGIKGSLKKAVQEFDIGVHPMGFEGVLFPEWARNPEEFQRSLGATGNNLLYEADHPIMQGTFQPAVSTRDNFNEGDTPFYLIFAVPPQEESITQKAIDFMAGNVVTANVGDKRIRPAEDEQQRLGNDDAETE